MWALLVVMALCLIGIGSIIYSRYYQDGIVSSFEYDPITEIMTVWYTNRRKTSEWSLQYVGSSTVWYYYPSFKRCSTAVEYNLSELHTKWKYNNRHNK